MAKSEIEEMKSISAEEKIMLASALGVITRNIDSVLPTTMRYVLLITFEDDEPLVVHSGTMNKALVVEELLTAVDRIDRIDAPTRKKEKK
jgi:galactose-1-phosphate uridylyltransferase